MKRKFLVGYDMGGSGWMGYLWARSSEEIERMYPELKVFAVPPGWMSGRQDVFDVIERTLTFDIDDPPSGPLLAIIKARP